MPLTFDFSGRTVVVTGGTRGIGRVLVHGYRMAGAEVIATGTGPTSDAIPAGVRYEQLDFNHRESLERFLGMLEDLPRLDVLVNNAGINRLGLAHEQPLEDYEEVMRVNLHGPFRCCRVAADRMLEAAYGRILNIASIWSVLTKPQRTAYTISKTGLVGLTRTLGVELAANGILVNALSPGFTATELTASTLSKAEVNALSQDLPIRRFADPVELVPVALFLTSDGNTYMTGQNVVVDGGFVCV